jgi:hypothetical protein
MGLWCGVWVWDFIGGSNVQDGQHTVEAADSSHQQAPGAAAGPVGIISSDAPKLKSSEADSTMRKETVSSWV